MHIWDTWYRIAPGRVCNAITFLANLKKETVLLQRIFYFRSAHHNPRNTQSMSSACGA